MAGQKPIHEQVAVHHSQRIDYAEKPENLMLDQSGRGPFFAEQMTRMINPLERGDAVKTMNAVVEAEIKNHPITGVSITCLADIAIIDDRQLPYPALADETHALALSQLLYDVMDGVEVATLVNLSADPNTAQLIQGKSHADVESKMGITGQMVGVGKMVVDGAIFDGTIRTIIEEMESSKVTDGFDFDEMCDVRKRIRELNIRHEVDPREAKMVLAYLDSIIGAEKQEQRAELNNRRQIEEARNLAYDAQQQLAERNLRLGQKAEATSYNAWMGAIIGKGGQTGLPGQIWAFDAPSWYKEEKDGDWNDFLDTVTNMSNKVLARKAALGGAKSIGKAYYDQGYPKVAERGIALAYEDNRTGFRDALMTVVQDLYIETITEEVNGRLIVREITEDEKNNGLKGQFVMRYNVVGEDGRPVEYQEGAKLMAGKDNGGRRAYVLRVADILLDDGVVQDVEHAKMAAALAIDFLELGFGVDGTDHERKCNFAVEGARANCRPGFKFGAKTETGEVFASAWTAYYQERFADEIATGVEAERLKNVDNWDEEKARDAANRMIAIMARKDGLVPQVLCGSILDMPFTIGYDHKGNKVEMSLGRAMQAGIDIVLNPESTEDLLFGIDKWFENAADFWAYVSSSETLEFKGELKEVDAVLVNFAKGLNNSYADLRDRGLIDVHDLIAAIGGAAGLVPSDPPILNVPFHNTKLPYSFIGSQLLDHMPALSKTEREEIRAYFQFDSDFARAIPGLWKSSLDPRLSDTDRQLFKDVIRNNKNNANAQKMRKSLKG